MVSNGYKGSLRVISIPTNRSSRVNFIVRANRSNYGIVLVQVARENCSHTITNLTAIIPQIIMTLMTAENNFATFESRMKEEGLSTSAIKAFKNSYDSLVAGETGMIAESSIDPATDFPCLEGDSKSIRASIKPDASLLKQTVVLKLNGGLGTSMGLDKAKSLLTVRDNETFLDLMAKQIIDLRKKYNSNIRFVLMNSFSTSRDTLEYLKKYPDLVSDPELELMQNKVPKVDAATLKPVEWPTSRSKEWCPPGHGDLYPSLAGSGKLDKLLKEGYKYIFVSNSDNLGATLDLDLLTYFAQSGKPFLMECCERTENDKKGGHLAVRKSDMQLVLRESAQCVSADEAAFQDITRHRFFNTNNLWIRLDKLREELNLQDGVIRLPMIRNEKTVDPKDSNSTSVYQLETAMGAAIECFKGAGAVCVPRSRFAPVKKCSDLLMLRSDAYCLTDDFRIILNPLCNGIAPVIDLDAKKFKTVQQLESSLICEVPSLVSCKRLKISGEVVFAKAVRFEGSVKVTNNSDEVKTIFSGTFKDTIYDVTNQPGLGPLKVTTISTKPIVGQKPGTSGLRKKTKTFMEGNYLINFVQSTIDALPTSLVRGGTVVVSGDGRYYNNEAIDVIVKLCVAAGVERIWIGQNGLLSTPAISAVIREREGGFKAFGGFILTASHNPGGLHEDFGIKYNCENGGPAPEKLTDEIFRNTTSIDSYKIAADFPKVDISSIGTKRVASTDGSRAVIIEVIDSAEDHINLLKKRFDLELIKKLFARNDFSFVYDCMHGVQGPYAKRIFVQELGASPSCILNGVPKDDFNGEHADPNLTYAKTLVKMMGLNNLGQAINDQKNETPVFGAACDGDADRNMILGRRFFVTPSDSLAIIAANAGLISYFKNAGGLKGVARSMPTSGALDNVAKALGIKCFEVPTGWKFFGNLMDSHILYGKENYTPFICGEESFGTGSDHVREKDGLWAVMAWLSILASKNIDPSKPLVEVKDIVEQHWAIYGRNYYCRYDYESVDKSAAERMMARLAGMGEMFSLAKNPTNINLGEFTLQLIDEFSYHDTVDGSICKNQGIRILFHGGSRIVFRLSGTGVDGATIRMYIERYESKTGSLSLSTEKALASLIKLGLQISQLEEFTGRTSPNVIT